MLRRDPSASKQPEASATRLGASGFFCVSQIRQNNFASVWLWQPSPKVRATQRTLILEHSGGEPLGPTGFGFGGLFFAVFARSRGLERVEKLERERGDP